MSRQTTRPHKNPTDVRPDSAGFKPPTQKDSYPDIPDDNPGLVGGPATESIPGVGHNDPLDPLGTAGKQKSVVVPPARENDGGEKTLSGRPRETGGERPDNH